MRKALSAYAAKTKGFYTESDMDAFMESCVKDRGTLSCTNGYGHYFFVCEQPVFMKDKTKAVAGDYLCVCAGCYNVLTSAVPGYGS